MSEVYVFCGGCSPEREVSLRSGQACHEALLRKGQDSQLVDIRSVQDLLNIKLTSEGTVMLMTHGALGEDGRLQGMLDWWGCAYTGSGCSASALCMDKRWTKQILREKGLPVTPDLLYDGQSKFQDVIAAFGEGSCFIKDRWGGSSIGAKALRSEQDWSTLTTAEEGWLLEPLLVGREVTVSLLECDQGWEVLPILELKSKTEFYDYHAKYTEGMTDFILPAPMGEGERVQCEELAVRALGLCEVCGFARVDMMLTANGPKILEINTLPGMTKTSDLPAQAKAAGIDFDDLVMRILKSARRWR